MLNSSLNDIYEATKVSMKSDKDNVFKACSLYGLYKAKGGKKEITTIESPSDIHYKLLGFAYKLYYSVLIELTSRNARHKKVQDVEVRHVLKRFYDDVYTKEVCSLMRRPYTACLDIRSNFGSDTIHTLVILGSKPNSSDSIPVATSNKLNSKSLLSDIALSHALAFYNSISVTKLSEANFKPFVVA